MKFFYVVVVETETKEEADQVIAERIGYDEDYGFNYTIDLSREESRQ